MNPKALKYILDIESVIEEIEQVVVKAECNFNNFKDDFTLVRTVERDLEIIGEAIRKLLEIEPNVLLSSTRNIIGLRNRIAHSYDSIENELLWGIINRDIPTLKNEIIKLKSH